MGLSLSPPPRIGQEDPVSHAPDGTDSEVRLPDQPTCSASLYQLNRGWRGSRGLAVQQLLSPPPPGYLSEAFCQTLDGTNTRVYPLTSSTSLINYPGTG